LQIVFEQFALELLKLELAFETGNSDMKLLLFLGVALTHILEPLFETVHGCDQLGLLSSITWGLFGRLWGVFFGGLNGLLKF
jgi:hypothetical protein